MCKVRSRSARPSYTLFTLFTRACACCACVYVCVCFRAQAPQLEHGCCVAAITAAAARMHETRRTLRASRRVNGPNGKWVILL